MSFFSKLFRKERSQQFREEDTSDDESPGPLSAPESLQYRRTTHDVPGFEHLGARRHGGELRRSRTFENSRFSTARSSTSSSDGTAADDKLRQQYRKVKQCHLGRNAAILEGTDRTTKRPVMIKAYAKQGMSVTKREKMERELAVLKAAAGAPGVVKLVNSLEDATHHYTVLEAVPGYTLIELMANNGGRLAESRCVIEVVVPLLNALAGLHTAGIVHRDIKPEHIICSYGSIRLLDFFESAQRSLQCLNYRAGQLEYMAPEVANKPRAEDIFHEVLYNGMSEEELPQYDEKADVWSAGAVIFETLTGRQMFPAESLEELQRLHTEGFGALDAEGLPAALARYKLSAGAVSFLSKMLRLAPADRLGAQALLEHPWVIKHTSSSQSQWLLNSAGSLHSPTPRPAPVSECSDGRPSTERPSDAQGIKAPVFGASKPAARRGGLDGPPAFTPPVR